MLVNRIIKENLISLSLTDLKKVGAFNSKNTNSIDFVIKKNGRSNPITIIPHMETGKRSLEFSYVINRELVNYTIELVEVPNPLTGRGNIQFVCPISHLTCRKLYLHENYFQHFSSIPGITYFQSTLSKKQRKQYQTMKSYYKLEKQVAERGKKHYKSHYNQILTHKHKKAMQAFQQLQNIATTIK